MAERKRRGARLRVSRQEEKPAADVQAIAIGSQPPPGGVRLDKPNQGPPPPEGSYLSMADFRPSVIAKRKRREAEER